MRAVCPFHLAEKCDVIKDSATEKLSLFDVTNSTTNNLSLVSGAILQLISFCPFSNTWRGEKTAFSWHKADRVFAVLGKQRDIYSG